MASTIKVDKIAQASGTPEFTIPTVDGAANTFLKTDGSGVLSFGSAPAGVALTGSTATWIPTITGANALTGTANFTYDGNVLDVKNSGTASSINLYCESSNAHYQKIKAAPHVGSTNWTLTLPGTVPTVSGQVLSATTAGVASWADPGVVLQVVSTYPDLAFTQSATASWTEVASGLRVSITPKSATSTLFLSCNFMFGGNYTSNITHFKLYDITNSADINLATQGANRTPMHGAARQVDTDLADVDNFQIEVQVSAANTNARTYGMYAKNESGTGAKQFFGGPVDTAFLGIVKPMIRVMEVAA